MPACTWLDEAVSDPVMVAIEVPSVGDPRLKSWAKVVDSVDDSRSTGYAFGGYFIATGGIQDVPTGSVLIVYGEKGSLANPRPQANVYTVNADGTLSHEQTASGRAWARTIRDRVAALVDAEAPIDASGQGSDPVLGGYSTEALLDELQRRGRTVDP